MAQKEAQEAIAELFRLYSNDVFRYARLTLGNHIEAKDVVQEVFFRAFRSWRNFRSESNAKTWLISIARNYMFDLLRKKRRERKMLLKAILILRRLKRTPNYRSWNCLLKNSKRYGATFKAKSKTRNPNPVERDARCLSILAL